MNPQGTLVISFKQPSKSETAHDFLWRAHVRTPGKGQVVIFNRSHYEDVLVVRVQSSVRLFKRSAEGDHNDNILEPDFFTHLADRLAFECEARFPPSRNSNALDRSRKRSGQAKRYIRKVRSSQRPNIRLATRIAFTSSR